MRKTKIPEGWENRTSTDGRTFYKNTLTGYTQWDVPVKPAIESVENIKLLDEWKIHKSHDGKTYYYNPQTGKSKWTLPYKRSKSVVNHNQFQDSWVSIQSHTTGKYYYYNTKTGETTWDSPEVTLERIKCSNIRGLSWVGNSCYLDSTLLSFFSNPTDFTDKILNMDLATNLLPSGNDGNFRCGANLKDDVKNRKNTQKALRDIALSIQGNGETIKNCSQLRMTLRKCPDSEDYFDKNQKDAGEFLGYILSLFPVNTAIKRTITYATNNMNKLPPREELFETSNNLDKNASIIQWVDSFQLLTDRNREKNISEYIKQSQDSYPIALSDPPFRPMGFGGPSYTRRISVEYLESSPYVVFSLKRINQMVSFIKTRVVPEEIIVLPNQKTFELSAIVLYENNHYTCTFLCGSEWYYFNDIGDKGKYIINRVGNYKKMLKIKPNPITNGTLYFYKPK